MSLYTSQSSTIVRIVNQSTAPTTPIRQWGASCPWCGRTCRCSGGTNAPQSWVIWARVEEQPKPKAAVAYRTFPEHELTDVQRSAPPRYQMAPVLRVAPRPWTQAIRAFRGIRRTRDVVRSER